MNIFRGNFVNAHFLDSLHTMHTYKRIIEQQNEDTQFLLKLVIDSTKNKKKSLNGVRFFKSRMHKVKRIRI